MRERWGVRVSVLWLTLNVSACATSDRLDDWKSARKTPTDDEKVCASVSINSRATYEAARDCTRIEGSLYVSPETPLDHLTFLELTTITGDVAPMYSAHPHPLVELDFPSLHTIGGSVTLSATRVEDVNWPELRSIEGSLRVISTSELVRFAAPKLERIGSDLQITLVRKLETIDLRALKTIDGFAAIFLAPSLIETRFENIEVVGGEANLDGLMLLSTDAILPLWEASDRTRELGQIGCCIDDPAVVQSNCNEYSELTCGAND